MLIGWEMVRLLAVTALPGWWRRRLMPRAGRGSFDQEADQCL
jgi:hypothetical protein